jgi:hypothetical protein
MPGKHAQLTTGELARAIEAATTLCGFRPYIEPVTFTKIDTLRADLLNENESRGPAGAIVKELEAETAG